LSRVSRVRCRVVRLRECAWWLRWWGMRRLLGVRPLMLLRLWTVRLALLLLLKALRLELLPLPLPVMLLVVLVAL
jgi:hypothetical protein